MSKYGLTQAELKLIQDIISSYPDIQYAILFGSRAMGNFKIASDIDIAIKGKNLPDAITAKLKDDFEDSNIPYLFDVINYHDIDHPELKKHIDTHGVVLFMRSSAAQR